MMHPARQNVCSAWPPRPIVSACHENLFRDDHISKWEVSTFEGGWERVRVKEGEGEGEGEGGRG